MKIQDMLRELADWMDNVDSKIKELDDWTNDIDSRLCEVRIKHKMSPHVRGESLEKIKEKKNK
jgi:hypothetical protein